MYGTYLSGATPHAIIDKRLRWHERVHQAKMAAKIVQTQPRLSPWLARTGHGDEVARLYAAHMHGCISRLRILQRAIVRYLYRPGGRMAQANFAALASLPLN